VDYEALYELQDRVLEAVFGGDTQFYLTGGTCLHRFYAGKRYSDDLDLFTADHALYRDDVRTALDRIRGADCTVATTVDTRDFVRVFVNDRLKVDFVNDRVHRHGRPDVSEDGYRLDNLLNIFANKICALVGRDEPKDVFDLCVLAEAGEPDSREAMPIAARKCVVDPEELDYRLSSFPVNLFETLAVIDHDYLAHVRGEYETIVRDLLDDLGAA